MASSLSWIPSAEKRLQRDAGIIIETVGGRLTILELKITSYRGWICGEKKKKKRTENPKKKLQNRSFEAGSCREAVLKRKTSYDGN